jgi:hypothetical protein
MPFDDRTFAYFGQPFDQVFADGRFRLYFTEDESLATKVCPDNS